MLPGISGEEVLQEIRKQGNTPVIILTAKDTIDDKVEVLQSGADDYVTKPFDIKEVLARVQCRSGEWKGVSVKAIWFIRVWNWTEKIFV